MPTSKLKIVSLNTWGDSTGLILRDVLRLKQEADVLGLQEVHHSHAAVPLHIWPEDPGKRIGPVNTKLFAQLCSILCDDFVCYYAPQMEGYVHDTEMSIYPELQYGNALFVRRTLPHHYRDGFIYGFAGKLFDSPEGTPVGKTGQAIDIFDAHGQITVAHAHGAWYKSDKTTNFPWRQEQVAGLIRLMSAPHTKHRAGASRAVLLGDLNVTSDTATIKDLIQAPVFGPQGAIHLNAQDKVQCTRTPLYTGTIKEADHAFASPCLGAKLQVDDGVASDHAALIVDIMRCV
jgi:endonuclease/exonuclease/phosphatase family metal-dependent hydrolase